MPHSNTSNTAYRAVIGIDWADAAHAVCLWDATTNATEQFILPSAPAAIGAWLKEISQRYGREPVAVALEQSRGPLMNQLAQCPHLVIFAVNPATLSRFRQAFAPSLRKSDPSDAMLLMELVRTHGHKLRAHHLLDAATRELETLVEARRSLIELRTALSNRLRQAIKDTFPQALAMVGEELFTTLATDFLQRWPSLAHLQKARPETIRRFFYGHHVRRPDVIESRLASIKGAVAVTSDEAVLAPARLLIVALSGQMKVLQASVRAFEKQIDQAFAAHPDAAIFQSLPGAGATLAPRLAAAFGQDRSRYADASALQRASGIAPVNISSGKMSRTCRRVARSLFLHQTFFEFAAKSLPFCPWAKAFFAAQRAAGKSYGCAIRALAFKWQRIIYACWKNRQPYNEAHYLAQLVRHGSAYAATL